MNFRFSKGELVLICLASFFAGLTTFELRSEIEKDGNIMGKVVVLLVILGLVTGLVMKNKEKEE